MPLLDDVQVCTIFALIEKSSLEEQIISKELFFVIDHLFTQAILQRVSICDRILIEIYPIIYSTLEEVNMAYKDLQDFIKQLGEKTGRWAEYGIE